MIFWQIIEERFTKFLYVFDIHKRSYNRKINVKVVLLIRLCKFWARTLNFLWVKKLTTYMYNISKIHQKNPITSEVTAHYFILFFWITLYYVTFVNSFNGIFIIMCYHWSWAVCGRTSTKKCASDEPSLMW